MTIGVDTRSNSLIVRAPDTLFQEVEQFVRQLDTKQLDNAESTEIISLKVSNASAVKEALAGIMGPEAISTTTPEQAREGGGGDNQPNAQQQAEFIRRMQEARARFQQGGGGRGPGGGGRGGGGRGGGGRGGGGRGD